MKRLLILLFIGVEFFANAQTTKPNYFTPVATAYEWNWGRFKYGFRVPTDTLPTADSGSIAYKNGVWYGKNQYWSALGGYGGGSDSSLFATRYWAYNTFQPIGSYLTASDLTPYYTKSQINAFFSGVTPASGYNKSNWDAVYSAYAAVQALSPAGWATQSALTDSANALRAAIGSGGGGSGDMMKAIYDANNNGIVDVLELSGVVIGNGTSSPTSIAGTANQLLRRNSANTAYEFFTPSYLTSVDTTNISNFSVKVRSLFNGTSPIAYANGNISLDTSAGKWRSENYFNTKYQLLSNLSTSTSLGTSNTLYPSQNAVKTYVDNGLSAKLNIPDTANKWISSIRRRGDTVEYKVGSTWQFAYKDSTGGTGGGDSSIFVTTTRLDSTINSLSVAVDNAGTGQNILFDRNDTIFGKRIIADPYIKVYTTNDSTIHIGLDSVKLRDSIRIEIADTAAAIRAVMGTGNGLAYGGPYGVTGYDQGVDTTTGRMWYRDKHNGNKLKWLAWTDSIDVTSYDEDAQTYFDNVAAAGVTLNTSQKSAVNTYILGLKSDGLWSLIYDQGLPVWGTASSSAVTIKNTHTTTWVNSPTFSSSGVVGNGTNQYGNLNFKPSDAGTQNSLHLGVYIQNNVSGSVVDIGCATTGIGGYIISKETAAARYYNNSATTSDATVSTSAGFSVSNRELSTHQDFYKNGSLVTHDAIASTGLNSAQNFFIMAYNGNGSTSNYSTRQISLWTVGSGLTATQNSNLASRVNALMTALGINVY